MPESSGVGETQRRAAATTKGLLVFLRRSAELRRRREEPRTSGLLRFFERAAALLRTPDTFAPAESVRPPLASTRLRDVLSVLGDPIRRAPLNIAPINVWSIAGLNGTNCGMRPCSLGISIHAALTASARQNYMTFLLRWQEGRRVGPTSAATSRVSRS